MKRPSLPAASRRTPAGCDEGKKLPDRRHAFSLDPYACQRAGRSRQSCGSATVDLLGTRGDRTTRTMIVRRSLVVSIAVAAGLPFPPLLLLPPLPCRPAPPPPPPPP